MLKKVLYSVFILFLIMPVDSHGKENIKTPNVSGQFYDSNPKVLSSVLDRFFAQADVKAYPPDIAVLIAPHAGYVYSGQVAAYSYKAASHNRYKTIVLLAPSHYLGFEGFSVGDFDKFKTPLGEIPVDRVFAAKLIGGMESVVFAPKAFEKEHSIEVQIPFIQKIFPESKIVPVMIGRPSYQSLKDFSSTLAKIVGDRKDVLVVVSTDMSHFHDDSFARKMDERTMTAVKNFESEILYNECTFGTLELCGVFPVVAALNYAREKGFDKIEVLKYANSGDVSGDYSRVVGYFSAIIYREGQASQSSLQKEKNMKISENAKVLTQTQKKRLIQIAKDTIHLYVKTGKILDVEETDKRFLEEEGAFVTIHKRGMLRGCIGNILGRGPLYLMVRNMAISAATQDPRFPPLQENELDQIDIEVSVLSKPKIIKTPDDIIMGTHGVIVSQGPFHSGVFLPQVADSTGWDRETFLSELCSQKAGLPPDAWKDPKTQLQIFTAIVFSEHDVE